MKQALIFKLDTAEYAIDSDALIKIDRTPDLTPLSYVSESILGLCSNEGQIIPVFDALYLLTSNSRLDIKKEKVRSLILHHKDKIISLVVEEIIENIDVDPLNVEYIDSSSDGVVGFMKYGDSIVQILGLDQLISLATVKTLEKTEKKHRSKKYIETAKRDREVGKQYLVFEMEDEKYGIVIESIREIIVDQNKITPIANSPREILGLITLRKEIIPVLDLRLYFKKVANKSDKNRILIVHIEDSLVGLMVDCIDNIVDIYEDEIKELTGKYRDEKVLGIAKHGKNLTTILSDNYLRVLSLEVQAYLQNRDDIDDNRLMRDYENYSEVVIFTLGDEEYAIDIEDILEIVRFEGFTDVVASKDYILGVINLRGEVIPVVSLANRLGEKESIGEHNNILISKVFGYRVGLFVESVSDIVEIALNLIKENSDKKSIFSHTILLDGGERMILKVAIENLFLKQELEICEEIGV